MSLCHIRFFINHSDATSSSTIKQFLSENIWMWRAKKEMRDDRAEKIGNSTLMGFEADEWMPTRYETETKFADRKIAFSVSLSAWKIIAFCSQVLNSSFASSTAYCDDYGDNEASSEGKLQGTKPIKKGKSLSPSQKFKRQRCDMEKAKKEMKNCLINYAHQ